MIKKAIFVTIKQNELALKRANAKIVKLTEQLKVIKEIKKV